MGAQERQVHAKVRLLEEIFLSGVESEGKRCQDGEYREQLQQRHGRWQPQEEGAKLPRDRASPAPGGQFN